jgi:hypothetical protein
MAFPHILGVLPRFELRLAILYSNNTQKSCCDVANNKVNFGMTLTVSRDHKLNEIFPDSN